MRGTAFSERFEALTVDRTASWHESSEEGCRALESPDPARISTEFLGEPPGPGGGAPRRILR